MAGFLYYKPKDTKIVTHADCEAWGLGYAFSSQSVAGTVCSNNTPDAGQGVVFGDTQRLGDWQPVMQMEEQQWKKLPKSDCYVGIWKAAPPVPDDLARPVQLPGYLCQMGDHEWIVPLTARFDEARKQLVTKLPCYLDCDDDGKWIEGDVLDVHRQLWDIGQPFREDVMRRLVEGGVPTEFTIDQLRNAAVAYIQANYVVGQGELVLMRGLTNEATIHGAILAANDMPTFWRWEEQQKKSEDVSSTVDGSTSASGAAA